MTNFNNYMSQFYAQQPQTDPWAQNTQQQQNGYGSRSPQPTAIPSMPEQQQTDMQKLVNGLLKKDDPFKPVDMSMMGFDAAKQYQDMSQYASLPSLMQMVGQGGQPAYQNFMPMMGNNIKGLLGR